MNWKSPSSSTVLNAEDTTHSMLKNVDNDELAKGQVPRRAAVIREIGACLVSCDRCTGTYEDSINGNILRITCRHDCHSAAREVHNCAGRECRKSDSSEFGHQIKEYYTGSGRNRILNPILK